MPKMKTNAAAKKRFSFTGTGKIKRKHAYHSHILTKKTNKRKRNLCYSGIVSSADEAKIKNLLVKEYCLTADSPIVYFINNGVT